MALARAMSAELLKTKRTLALWLAPIAPLVIVGLQVAITVQRREYIREQDISQAWTGHGGQIVFLWAVLMLPLFITLETALLSNLEHGNYQWKHIFSLPISRAAIYAAKQISGMAIIALSMAALYVYIVASGLLLRLVTPGLGFEASVPWLELFRYVALTYVASWLILSVHTWVGLRWHSFVVASTVGIVAMVVGVIVFQSDWGPYYPWTLPCLVTNGLQTGQDVLNLLLIGGLGGIVLAFLGGLDVIRRDVL